MVDTGESTDLREVLSEGPAPRFRGQSLAHEACPSQVNSPGAINRAQSCICWSSEAGAVGGAPQQLPTEISPFASVSDEKSARI